MSSPPRGALIVFEGLDRAGKSTQCARLVENLKQRGHEVQAMRFPDRTTTIGKVIDDYLKGDSEQEDHVIHLLFSANRWEAAAIIEANIKAGVTVVIDRYYYSGCVYSAAKHNPTLDLAWARKPDEGLPRPDICIFLDIATTEAAKRGGYGAEKYEKKEMQERVRELFEVMRASAEKDDFVVIDGGRPFEEVEEAILESAVKVVSDVQLNEGSLRKVHPW